MIENENLDYIDMYLKGDLLLKVDKKDFLDACDFMGDLVPVRDTVKDYFNKYEETYFFIIKENGWTDVRSDKKLIYELYSFKTEVDYSTNKEKFKLQKQNILSKEEYKEIINNFVNLRKKSQQPNTQLNQQPNTQPNLQQEQEHPEVAVLSSQQTQQQPENQQQQQPKQQEPQPKNQQQQKSQPINQQKQQNNNEPRYTNPNEYTEKEVKKDENKNTSNIKPSQFQDRTTQKQPQNQNQHQNKNQQNQQQTQQNKQPIKQKPDQEPKQNQEQQQPNQQPTKQNQQKPTLEGLFTQIKKEQEQQKENKEIKEINFDFSLKSFTNFSQSKQDTQQQATTNNKQKPQQQNINNNKETKIQQENQTQQENKTKQEDEKIEFKLW